MNNLYNFEAIFNNFLKSLNQSKREQKRHLVFFRSFINWLVFGLKVETSSPTVLGFLPFVSPDTLKKYGQHLQSTGITKVSIHDRLASLRKFGEFLQKHHKISITTLNDQNELASLSLLDEFISELEDKAAPKSTMRSYKSDLQQFLRFLKTYDPAQSP